MTRARAEAVSSTRTATARTCKKIIDMKLSEACFQELTDAVREVLKPFAVPTDSPVVTDIHLQPVRESGELVIYDDDRELSRGVITDLADIPEDKFAEAMENGLRAVLNKVAKEIPFDTLAIWKPFSFVLVDDERETLAELVLIDDDQALASQTLMAGLDEELDQFLKDLLS